MAIIKKSAIVPYSAAQMYELVNKVEDYPQFLPHCEESKVLSADEDEMRARLTLGWGGMNKSFTTCNRLQKNKMVGVRLEEGPIHHIEGFWLFEPLAEDACKIEFDLEYEIAGHLFSLMFGPIFHQMANSLLDSFVKRAKEVYGNCDDSQNETPDEH